MIPPKDHPGWKMLVTNQTDHQFKSFVGSILVSRLVRKTQNDDSQETINACITEAYDFFMKFEKVFQEDLKAIFK